MRRDLLLSLALIAVVVTFALTGLAFDHNWPKMLRVSSAVTGYSLMLIVLSRGSDKLQYWWFVSAGAVAGLLSGVVRPTTHVALVAMQIVAGALLLGGIYFLGLARWRDLKRRIETSSEKPSKHVV